MKIFSALFLWMAMNAPFAYGQSVPEYSIEARVSLDQREILAQQTVHWTNHSSEPVSEMIFHLYPNRKFTPAEKDFMWRFAGYFKVNPFPDGFQTGDMDVSSVTDIDGQPLVYAIEGDDETLLRVELARPVPPGEKAIVKMNYRVSIPRATIGRLGWNDGVTRLSRWYPILSVYENGKGWRRTPYYPFHRPFYSESAKYEVSLMGLPQGVIVAHTGGHFSGGADMFNPATYNYELTTALPVREFSFAFSADYRVISEWWRGITIHSYYLPGDERAAKLALQYAKDAMEFFSRRFGPYPYEEFRIVPVDLGYGGEQMSNMIFLDRRLYRMPGLMDRYLDFLVAHETGHQWFYNLVGVNEYEDMWLEEGLNSYFIQEYLEEKYGEDGEVILWPRWAKGVARLFPQLTFRNSRDTRYRMIARMGMDHEVISELSSFKEPSTIFSVKYGKGARVVGMLRYYVGDEVFERIFARILAEYRFRNLLIADFIRICEEESGQDLSSFFEQWLYGDQQLNYAVAGVRGGTVSLENRGGVRVPAKVRIVDDKGAEHDLIWKGSPDQERISLSGVSRIRSVAIDGEGELLDIDPVNNFWPRRWHSRLVPLYTPLHEISTMLPQDGYSLTAGPEIANNGVGLKASVQKPYDQIVYAATNYELSEKHHHSRAGYQLRNVLNSPLILGFEIGNVTDHDDGDDDLVSGKVFLRRELWPAQYNVADINDHVSLYLLRNQSLNQRSDLLLREGVRHADYQRKEEAIVGAALHLERSGPAPDPRQGYRLDIFAENAGHFLGGKQAFTRAAVETSGYVPVTNQSKAALRVKYGGGYPNDKELFYIGGIDGLRGYERKSVRGANILLGSLEYRFPIVDGLKVSFFDHILGLESVSGVIFGDAGQAWFSSLADSKLRKNAGLGLRLTVNVGSVFERVLLRLDVAQAIEDDREDDPRVWFGINHAF